METIITEDQAMSMNIELKDLVLMKLQQGYYIKNTYTTKKTKDLVSFQVQKYKEILQEMQANQNMHAPNADFVSDQEKNQMNEMYFLHYIIQIQLKYHIIFLMKI